MLDGVVENACTEVVVEEWRDLMARHAAVTCALSKELGDRHGIGVHEYEVLDRLADARHGKQRIQDLSEAVSLSQSALSRLVARLEREGLVLRAMCDVDRRGIYAVITDKGRERHDEARPTYRTVLAQTLAQT